MTYIIHMYIACCNSMVSKQCTALVIKVTKLQENGVKTFTSRHQLEGPLVVCFMLPFTSIKWQATQSTLPL